jgi:hypothetical protein
MALDVLTRFRSGVIQLTTDEKLDEPTVTVHPSFPTCLHHACPKSLRIG